MKTATYSSKSRTDLREILRFVARDKPGAALNLTERIEESCSLLAQHPELGTRCPEFGANTRAFVHGNYVIYYEALPDGVWIDRILHSARDERQIRST